MITKQEIRYLLDNYAGMQREIGKCTKEHCTVCFQSEKECEKIISSIEEAILTN